MMQVEFKILATNTCLFSKIAVNTIETPGFTKARTIVKERK